MLRGGANMYHLKEMLGHESLDTLEHYARLTITDLKMTHRKCHPRENEQLASPRLGGLARNRGLADIRVCQKRDRRLDEPSHSTVY